MMNNISKYYAKKKRKKTGVYKKVIKGVQPKAKKRQADKSVNSDNNNNNIKNNKLNKGNIKNNQGNKKNNNVNKVVQFKKSVIFNDSHKEKNTSTNNANNLNKTFISNNKSNKKNDNKKVLNVSSLDNKKIIKKPGSSQKVQNKTEKNVTINSKNNIKVVKIEEKPKSITPRKSNSSKKELVRKTLNLNNIIVNDLKSIKPEHTLIIHDINDEFANSDEFKKVLKSCGILINNNDK